MRTRTLLILATVCGLAILVAGGIQLIRVGGGGSGAADLAVGDEAQAGDLVVRVVGASEADGFMRVSVELGGVDDDGALDDFRLVVPGEALPPLDAGEGGDGACRSVTVAEQSCALVFATADVSGSARVLLLRRGEDQHRWVLA
ncbi:MAG: hypothetical protein AB7L17_08025 [Ilumatobacteraceae bacterium]